MTDPGVVTPDKNAETCRAGYPDPELHIKTATCGKPSGHVGCHSGGPISWFEAPVAPETPHAPSSAPGTPQRGSVDGGDGSEALREALAGALWADYSTRYSEVPPPAWGDLEPIEQEPWLADINPLMPLVVAYGDQRAAEALREAAEVDAGSVMLNSATGKPWRHTAPVSFAWRSLLNARADEIHGRQA